MSGGRRCPPFEDGHRKNTGQRQQTSAHDFRVPAEAAANWLQRTTYQIDNNAVAGPGASTTTTRHFASWEQTTTHFPTSNQNRTGGGNGSSGSSRLASAASTGSVGHHTHPLLAASVSLNGPQSPVIRPIPNRLASPPESKLSVSPQILPSSVKLETPTPPSHLQLPSNRIVQLQQAAALASAAAAVAAATSTEVSDTSGVCSTDGNDSAFEDWDTSCSRTTPINHKSIRRWRQQSQPGRETPGNGNASLLNHRKSSLATPPSYPSSSFSPISIMTSSPLDTVTTANGGPLSAPSGLHSWQPNRPGYSPNDSLFTSPASTSGSSSDYSMHAIKKRLKSETVTSPDSVSSIEDSKTNIPVGIAVARQRTTTMTSSCNSDGENNKSILSSSDDSGIEMKRPEPPPPPPPRPPTASNDNFLESWLRQPHLWPALHAYHQPPPSPIGGYQFVKDPLTGQMFFVPGFASPTQATPPLWSPPTTPNYGLTPFQQSLMQLQQESLLVRQAGFLFNQQQHQQSQSSASWPLSPLRPSAPRDPPTICESPDIKVNGGGSISEAVEADGGRPSSAIAVTDNDTEDNLSIGDVNDEFNPSDVPAVQPEPDHIKAEVVPAPAITPVRNNAEAAAGGSAGAATIKVKQEDKTGGYSEAVQSPSLPVVAKNGLLLLTEGIDRLAEHQRLKPPPPRPPPSTSLNRPSRLGLLCDAAFLSDDEVYLRSSADTNKDIKLRSRSLDSPAKKVKGERTLSSDYRSPKAERNAKAFIASKSLKMSDQLSGQVSGGSVMMPKQPLNNSSGTSMINADHKNSGGGNVANSSGVKMAVWEQKMRYDLADIQKKYKEKYKELYKLQHKTSSSAKKASHLNPHSASSLKGQNSVQQQQRPVIAPAPPKKTLAPISPWLQTFKVKAANNDQQAGTTSKNNSVQHQVAMPGQKLSEVRKRKESNLSHNGNGTPIPTNGASSPGPDLSTITSKFRSNRPSPFANLLKLSCVGKKNQDGVKKTEQEDTGVEVAVLSTTSASETHQPKQPDYNQAPFPQALATSTPKPVVTVVNNKKHGVKTKGHQKEAFLLQDDLKPLPKLHLASNNNIEADHGDADVSEEEEEEDGSSSSRSSPPVLEPMTTLVKSEPKNNITVKIKRPSSSEATASNEEEKRPKKSKKEKKSKKSKKERRDHREGHRDHHSGHHHHKKHHKKPTIVHVNDDSKAPADCIDLTNKTGSSSNITTSLEACPKPVVVHPLSTSSSLTSLSVSRLKKAGPKADPQLCVIKETDLVDGLRVLVKLEGHFHPGKIQAISPPDIYGVLVDKERGNKPHIFSREEVLREAIFEVKATSMTNLPIGTRVCAYWSQKYNHLYPGTISDMEIDRNLNPNDNVNIELDDGDNRDIHVNSIRFLPPNYPLVAYDPDPLMSTLSRRKRRHSWESGTSEGSRANKTPRASIDSEISPAGPPSMVAMTTSSNSVQRNHVHAGDLKMRIHVGNHSSSGGGAHSQSKQRKSSGGGAGGNGNTATGYTTTNGTGAAAHFTTSKSGRKASLAQRPSISSSSDSEDGKGGIASFLPKDQVWKWADKGQRRSKGRVYHRIIERKEDKLDIGDSAVFLSTNCPDQPYIGRLESMWETASGTKNVGVRWYYHLAEVECSNASERQKLGRIKRPKGALFESNHYDENDVQTISHRCDVQSFKKMKENEANQKIDHEQDDESNDKYYLAGTHNAIEKTVHFAPGVLKCDE